MHRRPILIPLLSVLACRAETGGTASSSRPLAEAHGSLYAASPDDGTVAAIRLGTRDVDRIPVGAEPARVALAGDRVLVTLRAERSLAVVRGGALERKVATGAEPIGVVATEDGTRAYVAASLANAVEEYGPDLEPMRRWSIPGQPRGLALHPSGRTLYVTTGLEGRLVAIDLVEGQAMEVELPTPVVERGDPSLTLSRRITADPAMSADGTRIAVPTMYEDTETPIQDDGDRSGASGYDGPFRETRRFNPCVIEVPLDGDGKPDGAPTVELIDPATRMPYISAVAYSTDGTTLWVAFEGADTVSTFPTDHSARRIVAPDWHYTAGGPDGLVPIEGAMYTRAFLDGRVSEASGGGAWELTAAPPLDPVKDRGRRLFYSAIDAAVTQPGLSCATCHFEGRTDGLTWSFRRGKRQTPSLAEDVAGRVPLRWEGDRASIADDAVETSKLMGGVGLGTEDAQAIARFVESVRGVDAPMRGARDEAIARGRAIFERAEVGCASCHSGALFTDNELHNVAGEPMKTPSLLGLAATEPYLHDGSVRTLADLVERARTGFMGNTVGLTSAERADLVAYLESL